MAALRLHATPALLTGPDAHHHGGRHLVDGSSAPRQVAAEVEALVQGGRVEAVAGWHISAVRQALAPRMACRVPYVYSALYEGGERTPGVFLTGETPRLQLRPAIRWLVQTLGARRWMVVGDDYVWPRRSAARARRYLQECGAALLDEVYVPLGTADFDEALRRVERSGSDAARRRRRGALQPAVRRAGPARPVPAVEPADDRGHAAGLWAEATQDLYSAAHVALQAPVFAGRPVAGRHGERVGQRERLGHAARLGRAARSGNRSGRPSTRRGRPRHVGSDTANPR